MKKDGKNTENKSKKDDKKEEEKLKKNDNKESESDKKKKEKKHTDQPKTLNATENAQKQNRNETESKHKDKHKKDSKVEKEKKDKKDNESNKKDQKERKDNKAKPATKDTNNKNKPKDKEYHKQKDEEKAKQHTDSKVKHEDKTGKKHHKDKKVDSHKQKPPNSDSKLPHKKEQSSSSNTTNVSKSDFRPDSPEPSTSQSKYKVDRYGFMVTGEIHISKHEKEIQKEESIKEAERELKWIAMTKSVKDWENFSPRIIHRRIKKGIPDCMRQRAWQLLLDPKGTDPKTLSKRKSIQHYVELGRKECCNTIEVDLLRTMPQMVFFTERRSIDSLRNLLHAYSNYDDELGYTQGMGFYAAMLLCYMEETQAFWCFANMMKGKDHLLRNFFLPEFPSLNKLTSIWDYYLKTKFPKISKRLEEIGVMPIMYVPSWFMCNFLNSSFPLVLRLRIFDCYLAFGTRSIFSFAITIVKMYKKELLTMPMENIVPLLQRPAEQKRMKDWRLVYQNWQENFLTKKQYRDLFTKTKIKFIP